MAHKPGLPRTPNWKGVVTHKRIIVIPLRLYPVELEHLNQQAKTAGLSREEFLRSLIARVELHPRPCIHHSELVRQVAGLCNNANQLARVANTYGVTGSEEIAQMTCLARKVWEEVKEKW